MEYIILQLQMHIIVAKDISMSDIKRSHREFLSNRYQMFYQIDYGFNSLQITSFLIISMNSHKSSPKVEPHREPTILPAIAKKMALKADKPNEKNPLTDRYDKFIKDQELNLKRDLQKLHAYEVGDKQTLNKYVKMSENIDQETIEPIRKAKSTPKLNMNDRTKSIRQARDRYIHNERLSLHFNLPKEANNSLDSSNDDIHKALLQEEEPRNAEPAVYVLTKSTQHNLIREKEEPRLLQAQREFADSKMEVRQINQPLPMIPSVPSKQQQIYQPPKEERYIKQKFVGQEAISKFYNRYKNIEKVREMQNFKLQFNPLTIILTILEHYNIPPKRMQVIKLKGEEAILDLRNCALGSGVSIKAVAEIIDKVKVFEQIDLSYNHIQADLCDLIIPNLVRMRRINLSYNKIGRRGMDQIIKMVDNQDLEQDCEIEELNIESNYINDTAIGNLFTHLPNLNSLLVLNLSKNYLGNFCASKLKEFLSIDNTLQQLYLHWAELGVKATKLIFEGLAKNNSVKVLDISWNQIGMDGIRPFCNFLTSNTALVHLDISFCEIDQIDTRKIAKVLKSNHTIYGLHYQGNLGFIDFKGYLHPINKEDRYIPLSIRAGLIQRINSVNIIKDSHAQGGYEQIYYKSICWICEGWEEKYFKIDKKEGEKACFIHFDFQAYNGVLMNDKGSHFELLRMCPLKSVHYFFTKVNNQNHFIHTYIETQTSQVKVDHFNSNIHEFIIDHKRFHEVHLNMLNSTIKPKYYTELFNEDYITKIHCIPRSDDLKVNQDLFNKKKEGAKKKKPKRPKKKKEVELIKEIEVKDIPEEFDSLFNKNVGQGEDYDTFIKKCVDFDFKHSKIGKIVKHEKELAEVRAILQKNYDVFHKVYYYLTNNNPSINGVYSIPQHRFQKFVQQQNFESKRVTKAKIRLKLITCLSNQQGTGDQIQGLYRPQFFQFLMRVAIEKWCQVIPKKQNETQQQKKKRQKYPLSMSEAFLRMLKTLKKFEDKADPQPWRRQNWSSYEINVVLKSYAPIFEKIYEKYAGMAQKNMNPKAKKKMLLEEFKIICLHADIRKTRQALKDLDVCYRTAKKLQVQDGISDTGLDFTEFIETFSRFAQGLYLKPIGSENHSMWQKELILCQEIPLFLKIEKLLKQIYKQNHDIKNKKFDILFQTGLFPEEVSVLMAYFKDKYEGGKDFMRKTVMMKHLKINSLEEPKSNKITLKFLIDLLKIKAAQIQQQNRQKMLKIEEQNEHQVEDQEIQGV